ncbi:MAG TPA: hypothetical protein VFH61_12700, partial [Thermoleophilia bacterium]|nr:hypothetical protein [Thermoleophilia bacterium]
TLDVSLAGSVTDVNGNFFPQILSSTIEPNPADTTIPTVVSVHATGMVEVTVVFSEAMDRATAETLGNYILDPGVTNAQPVVAALQPDGKTVIMQFDVVVIDPFSGIGKILRLSVDPNGPMLAPPGSITDINGLIKPEEDFGPLILVGG